MQYVIAFILCVLIVVGVPAGIVATSIFLDGVTDADGRLYQSITKEVEKYGSTISPTVDRQEVIDSCNRQQSMKIDVQGISDSSLKGSVVMQCLTVSRAFKITVVPMPPEHDHDH